MNKEHVKVTGSMLALLVLGSAGAAFAQAPAPPTVTGTTVGAPAPPAPPPPPYSLPWQLRPVTVGNVVRSDTSLALYEMPGAKGTTPVAGQSGSTVATMLLASYKLTPEFAPLVRLGMVGNLVEPGPMGGKGVFVNPIIGATYGRKLGAAFRWSGFLGMTLPIGQGGDKPAASDKTAKAVSRGIAARSAMDNAMFAVNYLTAIGGADVAYIANKLTVQAEVTLLQLFRTRNEDACPTCAPDSTRTNLTMGLHVGYFVAKVLSLGAELRHQRWVSTPKSIEGKPADRDTTTVAIGPRFHFKAGNTWIRPGLSYSTAADNPVKASNYHIFQLDVPVVF